MQSGEEINETAEMNLTAEQGIHYPVWLEKR